MRENQENRHVFDEENPSNIDVDFDALLGELESLRHKPRLTGSEIANMIYAVYASARRDVRTPDDTPEHAQDSYKPDEEDVRKLAEERIKPLLDSIVEKIRNECGDAGSFAVLPEALKLVSGEESKRLTAQNKTENVKKGDFVAMAEYYPYKKTIAIDENYTPLRPSEIIASLADSGYGVAPTALHHEFIHAQQSTPKEIKNKILKEIAENVGFTLLLNATMAFAWPAAPLVGGGWIARGAQRNALKRKKEIVKEAHAHFGSQRHTSVWSSLGDYAQHMEISYSDLFKTPEDMDRLLAATQAVRRLYALGLTDGDIGELVKTATWDKKRLGYGALEDAVDERVRQKGIEEEDLDNLVLADDIRRKIYVEKVRLIAQEELKKFYNAATQSSI